MKKYKYLICLLFSLILFGCTSSDPQPVNPKATKEAKELLSYLYTLKGKKILSGQHNFGHELQRSTDTVKSYSGFYPAIWGADFLYMKRLDNSMQVVVDEAIKQHKKGSIITLMYHQVKPFEHDSLGFRKSVKGRVTDEEWEQIVTPGTEYHKMLLEKIDNVAFYLKQLQDENIPILWRPYHEMNGMWFWWGDRKGPDGFVKLWHIMYDRYVNHHQLDNLIWVWNANGPRDWENDEAYAYDLYFPGIDVVDVLATDVYKNDYKQSHHDNLLALAEGKPIALGECGILPIPEILQQQTEWVWFMDWAKWIWTVNEPEDVKKLYLDEKVLTLDEVSY